MKSCPYSCLKLKTHAIQENVNKKKKTCPKKIFSQTAINFFTSDYHAKEQVCHVHIRGRIFVKRKSRPLPAAVSGLPSSTSLFSGIAYLESQAVDTCNWKHF